MTLLHWLYDAQVEIAGHAITWREIIGNASAQDETPIEREKQVVNA